MDPDLISALAELGFTCKEGAAHMRADHEAGPVLWLGQGSDGNAHVTACWLAGGRSTAAGALTPPVAGNDAVVALGARLLALQEAGLVLCAGDGCGMELAPDAVGHTHFGGSYCTPCGEAYKAENASPCSMCDLPYHTCVC